MSGTAATPRPVLEGIRVLELADWVAGPFAASILGDFGAEVVRIDLPGKVVNTRTLHGMEEVDDERSPFFTIFAHNKKSVTLDIRAPEGREVLLELVGRSHVLIEGFRPGTLERWDLGWDVLSEANPALVMLRISGYGQTGPWRERPGLDRVAQAFGGGTFLTGQPDGPPLRCGLGYADYSTGLWGALGIMLALFEQRASGSGRGQVIDQGLYESILPMLCEAPMKYRRYGEIAQRTGNRVKGVSPGDAFVTKDQRWFHISASGQVAFERLARAMGRADLVEHRDYLTMELRDEHNDTLLPLIAEWVATLTADELDHTLEEAGVPAARIQSVEELMEHPQVVARENFVDLTDDVFGTLPAFGVLPRLSRTPGSIRDPGPRLGEHNADVYGHLLHLSEERLEELSGRGVI